MSHFKWCPWRRWDLRITVMGCIGYVGVLCGPITFTLWLPAWSDIPEDMT